MALKLFHEFAKLIFTVASGMPKIYFVFDLFFYTCRSFESNAHKKLNSTISKTRYIMHVIPSIHAVKTLVLLLTELLRQVLTTSYAQAQIIVGGLFSQTNLDVLIMVFLPSGKEHSVIKVQKIHSW